MKGKDFRDINCLANTKMRFRNDEDGIKIIGPDKTVFNVEEVVLYFLKRGTKDDSNSCKNPKLYEEFEKLDDFDILSILYYWVRFYRDEYNRDEHDKKVCEESAFVTFSDIILSIKKSIEKGDKFIKLYSKEQLIYELLHGEEFYEEDKKKKIYFFEHINDENLNQNPIAANEKLSLMELRILQILQYEAKKNALVDELINRGYDLSELLSTPDDKGSKGSK